MLRGRARPPLESRRGHNGEAWRGQNGGAWRLSYPIRLEAPGDIGAITRLTEAAFRQAAHTSRTEQFIVDALRRAGQLSVSLVAHDAGSVVGHVAASPVVISSGATDWYGIGPISVEPIHQRRGIGSALMHAALGALQRRGARGCVLLGDPAFYGRFGFVPSSRLVLAGVPPEYFQVLSFDGDVPAGEVRYHRAFDATC